MDIKLYHKVAIDLTDKDKFAIGLTREIIEKIDKVIGAHTKCTFEEYFENVYDNNIIEFLYILENNPNVIEGEIADLEGD